MANQPTNQVQTIEITNFGGRLTRVKNGELNSGFANFNNSFGYDPFSKPGNLTWFEQASSVAGVSDLILAGKMRFNGETTPVLYAIGSAGNFYQIRPNDNLNFIPGINSVVGIASVLANSAQYTYGASIDFFGQNEKAYVASDSQINSVGIGANFGVGDKLVGTFANYAHNRTHPLKQFAGKLLFGNGPTIGVIDATNTVTSSVIGVSTDTGNIYSQLNPPLSVEANVVDIDVSPDNNYAIISAVNALPQTISTTVPPNTSNALPVESTISQWNGSDATVTGATTIPGNYMSALQTYLQNNMLFIADSFGAAVSDGINKILTLTKNQAPLPNATGANGNFLFWMAPEAADKAVGTDTTQVLYGSMYYFGSLDAENAPGLYRVLRFAPIANSQILQTPYNQLVSNQLTQTNVSISSVQSITYAQHYFSAVQASSQSSMLSTLNSFSIPASGTKFPQLGVYETQTQLFSKRVTIKQLRVYTEPTAANNSFELDCIGSDGTNITNGTFTYTFAAGTDITKLQGALERIDFNPAMKDTYALGVRVINKGTVNMTIKKIEVDFVVSGK